LTELAYIIFGFLLGLLPSWFSRKRRLKTHWCALRAEMILCKEKADMLLSNNVMSPLYRLPITAYQVSYPVLLADEAMAETEVLTLGRFFEQVQEINRGLDNAEQAKMSNDIKNLETEYGRNLLKAKSLVSELNGVPSLFVLAKNIVDEKISFKWWHFRKNA
jgi:hypothetical protein